MNDSDKFFSGPGTGSEESRPRAVNPRTGMEQSWQRASNYAAPLDNPHRLIKWKLRELVKGLSLRPDLARMLLTGAVIEDNAKADELIAQAHAMVALDAKANEGTAVHAALSRSFLGHEIPAEYRPHVNAFAAELKRNGLQPRVTEVTLYNTQLGALGHVDWIVQTADGRFVVLDVKTGKLSDSKRKFAVQCKVYAGADFMVGPDIADSKTPVPIPYEIDQTEAILAHVDPQTGATALYRVDLMLGFYGAVLAEQVRDWSKIEVLSPYVPPISGSAVGGTPFVPPATSPTTAAVAHPTPSPAAVPAPTASASSAPLPERIAAAADVPVDRVEHALDQLGEYNATSRFDELMKLDKAPLQMIIKNTHGGTDLAHNRRWLARWIMAVEQGMSHADAAKFAAAKTESMTLEGALQTAVDVGAVLPEKTAGDLSFIFKSIEGAKSEGAIEALRANIVERRGDQAWTYEMTAAARQRVAELLATPGNAVDPALRVLNKIKAATEQQHIADAWTEVTVGGSIPNAWTPDLDAAARARMAEIQTAQPPPPANPFGA